MRLLLLLIFFISSFLNAQTARFLEDLNTATDGSYPKNLTNVNDDLFFITYKTGNIENLWVMDGTSGNLRLLHEFTHHNAFFYYLSYKDQYIFSLIDNNLGGQLWKANRDGNVNKFADIIVDRMVVFNDNIFIISDNKLYKSDGVNIELVYSFEEAPLYMVATSVYLYVVQAYGPPAVLWKTDGTTENTTQVITFDHHSLSSTIAGKDNLIYFYADSSRTTQFWRSDGSEQGTWLLGSFDKFSYGKRYIQSAGEQVYFTPYTEDLGRELWVTDGTAENTQMVMDISEGTSSSVPTFLTDVQGTLFFVVNGSQLWKSNGAEESTVMVLSLPTHNNHPVTALFTYNNNIYFDGYTEQDGRELWITDGTATGTKMLKDIEPGPYSSDPSGFCATADALYFSAFTQQYATELWSTDGSSESTAIVSDINSVTRNSYPNHFTTFDNNVYFTAWSARGYNLFKTDLTNYQTSIIDFPNSDHVSESPIRIAGNNIYFISEPDIYQKEIWKLNGLNGDATFVKQINVRASAVMNDTFYFTSADSDGIAELWKSDGTEDGTIRITQVYPEERNYIDYFFAAGDLLFFSLDYKNEIWFSNGTSDGTHLISIDDNLRLDLKSFQDSNAKIYFRGNQSIWVSDGTAEGTKKLFDESSGFYINSMTLFKNKLYFIVQNKSTLYTSLYLSDGTLEGTVPVMTFGEFLAGEIYATTTDIFISANYGNALYKILLDSKETEIIGVANREYTYVDHVTSAGNLLAFSATTSEEGNELWLTDGSIEGTQIFDVYPGPEHGLPQNFYITKDILFFSALKENMGNELWVIEDMPSSIGSDLQKPGYFWLSQNYPNPFNPKTHFSYYLPKSTNVLLRIFDTTGRLIQEMDLGKKNPGQYIFEFDGTNLASNLYFYQIITDANKITKKMLLIK